MASIYFFRGKAATGKTTITNILSKEINVAVLRKDDVFDVLSPYIGDNSNKNRITYDLLAKLIQTNINNNTDLIVDIGLYNNTHWDTFQSNINYQELRVYNFLCDCSDRTIWENRIRERLNNPNPNQYFKSVEQAKSHYDDSDMQLLEHEHYIDSCNSLEEILEYIYKVINRYLYNNSR